MATRDDYLIETLTDMGLLTNDQVELVRPDADASGEGIVDTLITREMLKSADVAQARRMRAAKRAAEQMLAELNAGESWEAAAAPWGRTRGCSSPTRRPATTPFGCGTC